MLTGTICVEIPSSFHPWVYLNPSLLSNLLTCHSIHCILYTITRLPLKAVDWASIVNALLLQLQSKMCFVLETLILIYDWMISLYPSGGSPSKCSSFCLRALGPVAYNMLNVSLKDLLELIISPYLRELFNGIRDHQTLGKGILKGLSLCIVGKGP